MKRNIIITIISTIILLGISNNSASALTYSNNVDLEYTFAPTLDVSFSSNTGFVIEDLTPGTAADSNIVTVTASSNNSDGFTLAATAGKSSDSYRNNNRLVHSNNTNYFESIATNANTTLDNLGTNKWGYSVCTAVANNTCSTWSNYNGLPAVGNTGTQLAETNSAGGTSVDMKIGASSTNTQVSGTFTNDINFTITAKVVTYDYAITYNANDGGDGSSVSNMPTNTSGSLQAGQTLLTSNQTPTRTNYEFLGWCDGVVSYSDCSGNIYKSSDYLKIANANPSTNNTIDLVAVWGYYMQDFTSALCEEKAANQPYIVYDKRDNNSYMVQRLADGNCWMLDNLAFDIVTNIDEITIDNTNVDTIGINALRNGGTSPYSSSRVTDGNINSYTAAQIATSYKNAINSNPAKNYGNGSHRYGIYYNYCAASAGTYCYANGSGKDKNDTARDAEYDICPKGWRLPTGGPLPTYGGQAGGGEFQIIKNYYSTTNVATNPASLQYNLSTPLAGYFLNSSTSDLGTDGSFWSSTYADGNYMYNLFVNATLVSPRGAYYRTLGYSVRCLLSSSK